MSKTNELSIEEQEQAYEEYVEYQRQELRKEGAEELRVEILRYLDAYAASNATDPMTGLTSFVVDHIKSMVIRAEI